MKDKEYPLISIVMLNYNGLDYLNKTVPSILKLNYPNYEYIVVDNGSTDGSIDFIKSFETIRLVENGENVGYSKGKNIGFREANGEYVLSLDNDILLPDHDILSKVLNMHGKDAGFIQVLFTDIDTAYTKYYGIYFSFYGANLHLKSIDVEEIQGYKKQILIGAATGGCFFVSKKNWDYIGGFDESQSFNLDDMDVGPRAWTYGLKNYLYTESYAIHLGINKTQTAESYANRFRLFFSGHARSMIKNYQLSNLIICFPSLFAFQLAKSVRYSIKKTSPKIFFAFLESVRFFMKNLPDTLDQRQAIQSKRTIKNDLFLRIEPPKFD
jgi:GT2 family glycosyltransferase